MAKKPNAKTAAAADGAGQQTETTAKARQLTVSDERMDVVMRHVDRGLSKAHVTTLETIIAARLVAVSGAAQMATDRSTSGRLLPTGRKNPHCNRLELIDGIVADLRQALTRRLMPELAVAAKGEA